MVPKGPKYNPPESEIAHHQLLEAQDRSGRRDGGKGKLGNKGHNYTFICAVGLPNK
jgi:hypothetical protein